MSALRTAAAVHRKRKTWHSIRRRERATPALTFLYFMWIVMFLQPQWWLASFGPTIVLKVPALLFGCLLVVTLLHGPRRLITPLLAIVLFSIALLPVAYVGSNTLIPTKQLILYYILALATVTLVRTPRDALPIVVILLVGQFAWWDLHGALRGLIPWHPTYANYDGFGPLMVIGTSCAFYFGLAARRTGLRRISFAVAGACVVGLVGTFARGAILAGAFVLAFVWIRSPRKGIMTLGIVGAVLVVTIAAGTVFLDVDRGTDTQRNFWHEMGTIARDVNQGTGQDRRVLWSLAGRVFWERPLVGVGWSNFGAYAATNLRIGEEGGNYADNPNTLYGRALHSIYFQVLSESGLVGVALWLWLLVDFWRRNVALGRTSRREQWAAATGGSLDLRHLAAGLEAGMVAFLATGVFYDQLFEPWVYGLVTLNFLLYYLTNGSPRPLSTRISRRPSPRAP